MAFFRRYGIYFIAAAFLIFALQQFSSQTEDSHSLSLHKKIIVDIMAYSDRGVKAVVQGVQGVWEGYLYLVNLRKENDLLLKDNQELRARLNEIEEIRLANKRLQILLQFQESIHQKVIPAKVIGESPKGEFKTILVNKGERHGVKKGMAVIAPSGVVGKILQVANHSSHVLLLIDYNCSVDAVIQRSRVRCIVKGLRGHLSHLKYLRRTDDVQVKDVVVTSGFAEVFPKGLILGEVIKVKRRGYGIDQEAELLPAVDFSTLEEVLVVIPESAVPGKEAEE